MNREISRKKAYPGIDTFRLVAAILVVAIHTSPLSSYNGYADFLLTRIVGRVAVPFFFMVSGFFLFNETIVKKDKLISFLKKTSLYYVGAMLLYLPVNLYTGYFNQKHLGSLMARDILMDGTMYHLWYLPAAITGGIIAYFALKYLPLKGAVLLSIGLYIIGLFGDSYYGLTESIPLISGFYKNLFQVMDYTRNGIFFAPVFFVMGALLRKQALDFKKSVILASLFLVLLGVEGTLLKNYGSMRHDSMYLMLLPLMCFLFSSLLHQRGTQKQGLRDISLLIYIIHPLIIILIRGASKVLGIEKWTVYNSLLHFILTVTGAFIISTLITMAVRWLKTRRLATAN